ncbi:MAG: hypothetical protein JXL97_18250 [Bacteroidales bacterium]|nr:hypothetical protein [Bacteroidales bacterium]
MKKLLVILALVLPFSFIAISQVDDSDAQMFGSRRTVTLYNTFDFGTVNNISQHEFIIKNTSPSEMTVVSFNIPDGYGVVLYDKVIPAKSSGKFVVSIDPNYVDKKGDFEEKIIITTEQEDALGKKQTELTYTVKGSL